MARPLRVEYPGAVYHITSRGNRRAQMFTCDGDRQAFLNILTEVNRRFQTRCHTYCQMGNHYHLVLETVYPNLSGAMRQLNGVYTQTFNRLHRKVGHVLQGRYKAILVERGEHLMETCRYVVLNPVRAGMTKNPEDWEWSSYKAMAGLAESEDCLTTDWILGQFDTERTAAMAKYREFVQDAPDCDFSKGIVAGVVYGSRKFASLCALKARGRGNLEEVPREQRYAGRPELGRILEGVGERTEKIRKAVEVFGYTQKAVADELGMHYSTISKVLSCEMSRIKT